MPLLKMDKMGNIEEYGFGASRTVSTSYVSRPRTTTTTSTRTVVSTPAPVQYVAPAILPTESPMVSMLPVNTLPAINEAKALDEILNKYNIDMEQPVDQELYNEVEKVATSWDEAEYIADAGEGVEVEGKWEKSAEVTEEAAAQEALKPLPASVAVSQAPQYEAFRTLIAASETPVTTTSQKVVPLIDAELLKHPLIKFLAAFMQK